MSDGSIYPPILHLLRLGGRDYNELQRVIDLDEERRRRELEHQDCPPPHAVLPQDDLEQVPVHGDGEQWVKKRTILCVHEMHFDMYVKDVWFLEQNTS